MSSPLATAFEHHTWATLQLIDACRKLPAEALDTPVPGAFGSLLETLRHYINSDSFYLGILDCGVNRQESARRLGLDEGFVAQKLGSCPIETKIDILNKQVGRYDHIGRIILWQNGAVVADPPQGVSGPDVIYEVEFTTHTIDTSCLNT